jgi:hypothetical protein
MITLWQARAYDAREQYLAEGSVVGWTSSEQYLAEGSVVGWTSSEVLDRVGSPDHKQEVAGEILWYYDVGDNMTSWSSRGLASRRSTNTEVA